MGGYCHTEGLAQNTKPTLLVESGYLIAASVIQGVCSAKVNNIDNVFKHSANNRIVVY